MREKLRGFYSRGEKNQAKKDHSEAEFKKLVKTFEKEANEFLEGGQNQLPRPLEYYVDVFSQAFALIKQHPDQLDVLQREYVTFSENLLEFIKK